jgi:four helix bundle protein
MKGDDLQVRTKKFAIRIIKFVQFLDKNRTAAVIDKQLLRSGTSVAANYRAACRAKSVKDFINKLAIIIEEADETMFWLELLMESGIVKENLVRDLYKEAKEITAIMVASKKSTVKNNKLK